MQSTNKSATLTFAATLPQHLPGAAEQNDAIFSAEHVLGVEVTVPAFAARCTLGNIDPQHSGDDLSTAAIEAALTCELPPEETTLVTVRPDLDSVGAMAVIAMRLDDCDLSDAMERIRVVGETDRFGATEWPGRKPLPSREDRWPSLLGSLDSGRPTAVMQAVCLDFRKPLEERVALVRHWLLTGEEPEEYVTRVEAARDDMIRALESGEIRVRFAADGRIAVVESRHPSALFVGYCHAPVVVARNDRFQVGRSGVHVKDTVCQYGLGGYLAIRDTFAELNTLEQATGRWGGSATIGGSPQGESSSLALEKIVEVVERHLI